MKYMAFKYTKEKLEAAVSGSISIQDVARKILGKSVSGNQHRHIRKMIQKFGINTDHFLGSRHNLGVPSNKKKIPSQIFILGQRQKSFLLRRALLESGIGYKCLICGINKWKDLELNLEVDHIDGNSADNRLENLRFLCPNCHAQTNTFGFRGKKLII